MLLKSVISLHFLVSASTLAYAQEATPTPSSAEPVIEEEVVIEAKELEKILRGVLKNAMQAYNAGDFAQAEKEFSVLATKQFIEFDNQINGRRAFETLGSTGSGTLLRLGLNLPDDWDDDKIPYVAGSRAKARSVFYQPPIENVITAASKLYYIKGITELQQSKLGEAEKSLRKAIRFDSKNVEARVEYALVNMRQGQFNTLDDQFKIIDRIFAKFCERKKRCKKVADTKKRYEQIQLAYANMK